MNLVQKYLREASLRKLIKEEEKIKNPDTGRMIKLSSALSYDKDTAVYKAAVAAQEKKSKDSSPVDEEINNKYKEHFKNKIRKEYKNIDPEDLADETITLFKNKKIDTKTIRATYQNLKSLSYNKADDEREVVKAIDYVAELGNSLTDKELLEILSPHEIGNLTMIIEDDNYADEPTFQDRYYAKFYNKISDLIDGYDDWEAADAEFDKSWEENTK